MATPAEDQSVGPANTPNKKLPLSRVKKIAKMDEDVMAISNSAALLISSATEKFAAYFAEQSFFFTLAEKKKGLQYRHCAAAVARLPQLDFLADVVPQISRTDQDSISRKAASGTRAGKSDTAIPAWALPHPEVTSKIREAQAAHRTETTDQMDEMEEEETELTESVDKDEADPPREHDDNDVEMSLTD